MTRKTDCIDNSKFYNRLSPPQQRIRSASFGVAPTPCSASRSACSRSVASKRSHIHSRQPAAILAPSPIRFASLLQNAVHPKKLYHIDCLPDLTGRLSVFKIGQEAHTESAEISQIALCIVKLFSPLPYRLAQRGTVRDLHVTCLLPVFHVLISPRKLRRTHKISSDSMKFIRTAILFFSYHILMRTAKSRFSFAGGLFSKA